MSCFLLGKKLCMLRLLMDKPYIVIVFVTIDSAYILLDVALRCGKSLARFYFFCGQLF